jgi:threonine dehydratase
MVKVPQNLRHIGVLSEPASVCAKAIDQAYLAQQRLQVWEPKRAFVLGAGQIGLLATMMLKLRGLEVYTLATRPGPHLKSSIVEAYGATLHRCAPTIAARELAAETVRREEGVCLVHPYTNTQVIAGQGTAAVELIGESGPLDMLIAPVGGGGLISGTAIAASALAPRCRVIAAEPAGAADTFESLQRGQRVGAFVPETICDGLRTLVGEVNFSILRLHDVEVLTAEDNETIAAMRLIWQRLKIIVEPSAAIVLAIVLKHRERFAGKRIGLILSGGNVDLDALPW